MEELGDVEGLLGWRGAEGDSAGRGNTVDPHAWTHTQVSFQSTPTTTTTYVYTYVLEQLGWDQQHKHVKQSKDIRTQLGGYRTGAHSIEALFSTSSMAV